MVCTNEREWEEKKTVSFHTLGCRLNMAETGNLVQQFVDRGFKVVDFGSPADVVFLNTCTVTDQADSTCRQMIKKANESSPEATLVVAGCYAQMNAEQVAQLPGVDLVLGTNEKFRIFDYLKEEQEQQIFIDQDAHCFPAMTSEEDGHTRAFLKIQDGCNYICSFCIIPFARGRSRTLSSEQILSEAKKLLQKGFQEIVLTGVNIGEYEGKSGEKLEDVIQKLCDLDGLKRLRLSSVEPNTITMELLKTLKQSSKFMPHVHLPLQSGCDDILRLMRRKYDKSKYRDIVAMVKDYFPDAAIGADVIAGFPSETMEQFEETYAFLNELPISHFHVFPYSRRKGTMANRMPHHVNHLEKKKRVKRLLELGNIKKEAFAFHQLGKVQPVLFESIQGDFIQGLSPYFLKVKVPLQQYRNQILPVRILRQQEDTLYGIVVE
jgi:threonylcarbamoyladenosine tRNA methylthiotransferase MtaB